MNKLSFTWQLLSFPRVTRRRSTQPRQDPLEPSKPREVSVLLRLQIQTQTLRQPMSADPAIRALFFKYPASHTI